ncbi:uncharacterized protein LOC110981791 isoform X2 [Acanthaster planci]|uniref:Uncharacterized protein LOC110981791 isoform X2 n=1 Tax=Acanthaster planci TaxID=133434 RepID=A0A8B7YVP0_ACAPL|nr:uncharacterized protein LOC110981791 isoform X2 [Acanthaster planci]
MEMKLSHLIASQPQLRCCGWSHILRAGLIADLMMAASCQFTYLTVAVLLSILHSSFCFVGKKKVLADVTSNKLTREHDGSFGLWSFHGMAAESHAQQTVFTYNADLLSTNGSQHISIASTLYPWMGLTSDQDPLFQEYLFLQGRTAGIDGFLLEWGHMNHSSNAALLQLLRIAKKYGAFTLGINWCDHWLTKELKNKTSAEVVNAFHSNLQYLVDSVFIHGPDVMLYHGNHPVIFIFGGGLTSKQFAELLNKPLSLPPDMATPIWIGCYLNFASSPALWEEWGRLLNGTFGWAPFVERPTPANMSEWDYYGTVEDAVQYQRNLSEFGSDCVANASCVLWCGSVSPGFDNRGCAGWGRSLRYLPRFDLETHHSTYIAQWEFYIELASSPDVLIIPTMNDFPEATVLLPTSPSLGTLHSTAWLSAKWKNISMDIRGVSLPATWFSLYSQAMFHRLTPRVNVSHIILALEETALLINSTLYIKASSCLHHIRKSLQKLTSQLKVTNMTLDLPSKGLYPTVKPTTEAGSYVVRKTEGLFLAVDEARAAVLRAANFKGLLRFEYRLQEQTFSHLRVYSSTSRQDRQPRRELLASRYPGSGRHGELYIRYGDYAEVCDIMVASSGTWESAVVALYKVNQAWDHSAEHSSDLYFVADHSFLLRNISLEFQIFSVDSS